MNVFLSFSDLTMSLKGYRFPLLKKARTEINQVKPLTVVRKMSVPVPETARAERAEPESRGSTPRNNCGSRIDSIWSCRFQEPPMNTEDNDERPVECPSCDRRFKRLCDWYRHNRAMHLRIGVLCPECEHRMSSMGVLTRHLWNQHGIRSEYRVPRGPHRTRTARVPSRPEPSATAPNAEPPPVGISGESESERRSQHVEPGSGTGQDTSNDGRSVRRPIGPVRKRRR